MSGENESGILSIDGSPFSARNPPGKLSPIPYIVTVQHMFRIDAASSDRAENAALGAVNINARLAIAIVGQGVFARILTPDLMKELGLTEKDGQGQHG